LANIFTKPLSKGRFENLREKLGVNSYWCKEEYWECESVPILLEFMVEFLLLSLLQFPIFMWVYGLLQIDGSFICHYFFYNLFYLKIAKYEVKHMSFSLHFIMSLLKFLSYLQQLTEWWTMIKCWILYSCLNLGVLDFMIKLEEIGVEHDILLGK